MKLFFGTFFTLLAYTRFDLYGTTWEFLFLLILGLSLIGSWFYAK